MSKYFFAFIISYVIFTLTSCSVLSPLPSYTITKPQNPTISFTGRGAASGPMLMGAMGPSGIAIGLAIDVGIAKDIEKYGFKEGLNIDAFFDDSLKTVPPSLYTSGGFFQSKHKPHFNLSKIGFVEPMGQSDTIFPALELTVTRGDWQKAYHYRDDFQKDKNTSLPNTTLEQLKGTQSPARQLISRALTTVIEQCIKDWQMGQSTK